MLEDLNSFYSTPGTGGDVLFSVFMVLLVVMYDMVKVFFWNTHLLPRLVGLFFENLDNCCLQLMNFLSVVYTHILYFRWRHRKVKLAFEQPNWWYLLSNDFSFKALNEEWGNSTHYVETLNRDLSTTAISSYSCYNN